jgi:hypothetical protein
MNLQLEIARPVRALIALLLFASFGALTGCRKPKAVSSTTQVHRDRSAGYLLKRYERNEFMYDWLGIKIDAEIVTMGKTESFKANIRMKRDSVIWVSISPALGIEVFRVLITPDSVKYISRIPDDKYFYLGGFETITDVAKVDMDFHMLQDILIGNAVGIDKDEGKFRTEIDENKYLLISRYKRRVRRIVGVNERKLSPGDTIVVNPNDPRYQRSVRRSDEEDLIISRYWLEPENYRLVKSLFNDLLNQRTVEINYESFEQEGEQFYPSRCRLNVRSAAHQQEISFRILKLALNKPYDFPFEIPSDFTRKMNP